MKYPEKPLSQCENIILEAKRVLLNEQLDKVANTTLAQNITERNTSQNLLFDSNKNHESLAFTNKPEEEEQLLKPSKNIQLPNHNISLLNKYLLKWKCVAQSKKQQTKKLDNFIDNLKNCQNKPSPVPSATCSQSKNSKKVDGCFKNRYRAQKQIINVQQSKIEEQNKIINELKLGIIREDLLKSIENTRVEIREIFSNCPERVISKAPLLVGVDEREKLMVHSQKVPKIVQRMHYRAIERAKYRGMILERKKLIEEARQKLLAEAIEKKKALEEEERKHNLELINEQRKKELHVQKIRQQKRQEFEEKLSRAIEFYHKLLKKQCFKKLFICYSKSKERFTLATQHYLRKQKNMVFKTWFGHVEARYKIKYEIADGQFEFKILQNAFKKLKQNRLEAVRSMQVAEDLYDFRLTSNTFIYWHRYVCIQIMLDDKKMQIAVKHNNRRMLFQYFYQWRSLPAVIQLEKAKEEKKRKWREKVWEILPDYQPPPQV